MQLPRPAPVNLDRLRRTVLESRVATGTILTIGYIQRSLGYFKPPIQITITSPGDNDYQELKSDSLYPSNSILSRTPSPRSSNDDYPPFLPSPVSRTVSNEFSDGVSDLVWLKLKIKNRTVFGVAYPRIIPRSTWNAGRRFIKHRRRCTKRQTLFAMFMFILLLVVLIIGIVKHNQAAARRRGWAWGLPGMDANGNPFWEFTFKYFKYNYGGLNELVPRDQNIPEYPGMPVPDTTSYSPTFIQNPQPTPFYPYPDYNSESYKQEYPIGSYVPCRGFMDDNDLDHANPLAKAYEGIPFRKADSVIGSTTLLGMNGNVCYERTALLSPYGFGENSTLEEGFDWKNTSSISFDNVDWGTLQKECVHRNRDRFDPEPKPISGKVPLWTEPAPGAKPGSKPEVKPEPSNSGPKYHPRTAVVFRAWDSFKFLPDDIINLRRIIAELSLYSGGEYAVHIIVDVKNFDIPIWASPERYQDTIASIVPEEFRNITELVNEPEMTMHYWGAQWHDSYRSLFMPLQLFSINHPEYDFVWQWEMDMRYIGHHYHFLESIAQWAKKQPRKELWERSTRHYIPQVHGTWDEYSAHVSSLYPNKNDTIWGPVTPAKFIPIEPDVPPTPSPEGDDYEWGVGEEADLITLLPMFDPTNGTWSLKSECRGYEGPVETLHRRSAIVTASRLSKRLLWRMHQENAQRGHACAAEMWPATNCLHHGLKAVYAPHPIWFEKDWQNLTYINNVFNGGTKGSVVKESVYGAMEHNFSGLTWYYNTRWARRLYRRWLGFNQTTYETHELGGGRAYDKEHGNMCVEGVLLHPIKDLRPHYD